MQDISDHTEMVVRDWTGIHTDADVDILNISLRLIRAGRILESRLDQITRRHGLATPGDYELVATLRRAHPTGIQPAELARRLMVTTSGMTGRLDRLERDGLLERRRHPTDRRSVEVFITDRGIQLADLVLHERLTAEADLLHRVSPEQREKASELLQLLLFELNDRPQLISPI
jgi:DNA-binding MarR family transcriptional regulator